MSPGRLSRKRCRLGVLKSFGGILREMKMRVLPWFRF